MARIGILGGTFDPPHLGHLAMADIAKTEFSLDTVWWTPTYKPPHKKPIAPFEDRCKMSALMCVSHYDFLGIPKLYPGFEYSPVEKDLPVPSRTINMLKEVKSNYKKSTQLFLIIGADTLATLLTWEEYENIMNLVNIIVIDRDDQRSDAWHFIPVSMKRSLSFINPGTMRWKRTRQHLYFAQEPGLSISSTSIRKKIREGRSINYTVPIYVREYISSKGLYK